MYDDVIEDDPAYQSQPGPVSNLIFKAYQALTPEQDTLDEIEKNKQLRSLSTAQALKGTKFEEYAGQADLPSFVVQSPGIKERLDAAGYKPQGFKEGISRIGQFFYGDQRQAFDKLRQGQQLTDQDRTSIAMSPLDALDFIFPPLALKKLAGIGLKTVDDVLKSTSDLEEVKQLKNYFGGQGFTPEGVVRAPETGTGLSPATKAKRDKIFEEKRKVREAELIENAKKFETKKEAIAASGLSKDRFNQILRANNLTAEDLGLKVGKRGTPDTSAEKKKILDDFLAKNPDKTFTRQELAEATGMPKNYVRDKRIYQTDAPNLVTYASRKAEEFDTKIKGVNELLEDLKKGIGKDGKPLDKNMGPDFYKGLGYNIEINPNNYIEFPKKGQFEELTVNPGDLAGIIGKKESKANTKINNLANYLNVNQYKSASTELAAKKIMLRDYYRGLSPEGKTEFDNVIMDPEGFGFLPKKIMQDGLPVENPALKTKQGQDYQKQAMNNLLGAIEAISGGPDNVKAIQKMQADKKILNAYADEKFFNLLQNNKAMQDRFLSEANRVAKTGLKEGEKPIVYKKWEDAFQSFKDMFHGQLSHVVSSKHLGTPKDPFKKAPKLEGKKQFAGLMRINFGNHNISLQPRIENVIDRNVIKLTKSPTDEKALQDIANADVMLKERGMLTYMRFTDKEMSDDVFTKLQGFFGPRQVFKEGGRKTIMLGQPNDPTVDQLKRYLDNRLTDYENNPNTFKLSAATPEGQREKFEDVMMETGDNDYIAKGFLTPKSFDRGGAVKMAKGGLDSVLENMNQQNFTPDPAIDGDSAFQQAVKSGNMYAFNPGKLFKLFGDVKSVLTPNATKKILEETPGAAPGTTTTLPVEKPLQDYDFAFKSFTLDKITGPNAPKAAKPQAWIQYLQGGSDKAPSAELLDSGLFQYMSDFEKFFPNQKMTQEQIVELYESSPIANLKVKVKTDRNDVSPYDVQTQEVMGRAKHQNAGNVKIDEGGKDYREIVIEAGELPGQKTSFVNSTHFNEPNVLVFSRVANYENVNGDNVAVKQEMQTDLLTKVRKEQERLNAIIENKKLQIQRNNDIIQNPNRDDYERNSAQQNLTRLVPEINQLEKVKETNLISPYPMTVAKDLIPTYQKQLNDVQQQINTLMRAGIDRSDPEFLMKISELEAQQQKVLDDLLNLNRTSNFEDLTQGIKVPSTSDSESLANIAAGRDNYMSMKDLETFPPIPFNKQPDYVDLILKATIKDAENRGINKIAIMPADVGANPRWNKATLEGGATDKTSGDKFRNLYDKVGVQQLKNIAKKYNGELNIEKIVDPTKASRGLTFYNKNPEGNFQILKQTEVKPDISIADRDKYYDEELTRIASGYTEPGDLVLTREIAPGQMMDYYIVEGRGDATDVGYRMIPLKEGQSADDAMIKIVEYNPSEVDMYTLTLPKTDDPKAPMFMFKKKEGGKIPGDRLVSITDIYGDY